MRSNFLNTLRVNSQTPQVGDNDARKSLPELLVEYEATSSPPPQRNDGLVEPRLATMDNKPTLGVRTGLKAGDDLKQMLNGKKNESARKGATETSLLGSQMSSRRSNKEAKDDADTAAKFDNEHDLLASVRSSARWDSRNGRRTRQGRVASVDPKKGEDGGTLQHFSSQQSKSQKRQNRRGGKSVV